MELNDIRLFREAMRQLQRSLSWQWKSDASCCGITVAQCHALLEIGKRGKITLVDLAAVLGLDTSTLSRTIDGMVKSGLVERQANPKDRRCLNIVLTRRGKTVFNDVNCTFDSFYAEIFAGIPAEKQAQIAESIDLLAGALANSNSSTCCREEQTE